jgi:hypothetical protein
MHPINLFFSVVKIMMLGNRELELAFHLSLQQLQEL